MEEDLVLGEEEEKDPEEEGLSPFRVIETQLDIVNSIYDLDESMYSELREDKLKVIVRALRIIYKIQSNLLKDI